MLASVRAELQDRKTRNYFNQLHPINPPCQFLSLRKAANSSPILFLGTLYMAKDHMTINKEGCLLVIYDNARWDVDGTYMYFGFAGAVDILITAVYVYQFFFPDPCIATHDHIRENNIVRDNTLVPGP